MVEVVSTERSLLADVLEREYRNALRMLNAFPAHRLADRPPDCQRSARELAWAFVERERLMLYVLRGRTAGIGERAPDSLHAIVTEYESVHRESRAALARVTREQWQESIRGPVGLTGWERGRRGELLWMAWKELVHHVAHFACHLRMARQEEAARRARADQELQVPA